MLIRKMLPYVMVIALMVSACGQMPSEKSETVSGAMEGATVYGAMEDVLTECDNTALTRGSSVTCRVVELLIELVKTQQAIVEAINAQTEAIKNNNTPN